jgi:hypothetical protein
MKNPVFPTLSVLKLKKMFKDILFNVKKVFAKIKFSFALSSDTIVALKNFFFLMHCELVASSYSKFKIFVNVGLRPDSSGEVVPA